MSGVSLENARNELLRYKIYEEQRAIVEKTEQGPSHFPLVCNIQGLGIAASGIDQSIRNLVSASIEWIKIQSLEEGEEKEIRIELALKSLGYLSHGFARIARGAFQTFGWMQFGILFAIDSLKIRIQYPSEESGNRRSFDLWGFGSITLTSQLKVDKSNAHDDSSGSDVEEVDAQNEILRRLTEKIGKYHGYEQLKSSSEIYSRKDSHLPLLCNLQGLSVMASGIDQIFRNLSSAFSQWYGIQKTTDSREQHLRKELARLSLVYTTHGVARFARGMFQTFPIFFSLPIQFVAFNMIDKLDFRLEYPNVPKNRELNHISLGIFGDVTYHKVLSFTQKNGQEESSSAFSSLFKQVSDVMGKITHRKELGREKESLGSEELEEMGGGVSFRSEEIEEVGSGVFSGSVKIEKEELEGGEEK